MKKHKANEENKSNNVNKTNETNKTNEINEINGVSRVKDTENRESYFLPLAGKAVIDMEKPNQVNTSYPEFVPSFHSWMLPQQQVEIANELVKMTKRNKGENCEGKNNKK